MVTYAQFEVDVAVDQEAHAFHLVDYCAVADQVAVDVVLLFLMSRLPLLPHDKRHANGFMN